MKRIAIAAIVVVAIAAVAIGALVVFPPKEWVKGVLADRIKKATGRELVIKGATSVRLLPNVILNVENVELREPSRATGEPLFAAKSVLIEAKPWQMIFGSTIDRVSLEAPRVVLASDTQPPPQATGQPTTIHTIAITGGSLVVRDKAANEALQMTAVAGVIKDLAGSNAAELIVNAETTIRGAASAPALVLKALDIRAKALGRDGLGEVALKAVQLRYGEGPAAVAVETPQASAKSVSWNGALDAAVAFAWSNEPVTADVRIQSPSALLDGKSSPVTAKIKSAKGTLDIDATLAVPEGGPKIEGKANAAAPSLRELAAWANVPMPGSGKFGDTRVEGEIRLEGKRLVFDKASFVLDATKATGSVALDFAGTRPVVSGQLSMKEVNVDSYLEAVPAAAKKGRVRELPPAAQPTLPPGTAKDALKSALRAQLRAIEAAPGKGQDAPSSSDRAVVAGNDWPDDVFNVGGLNALDAELAVSVVKLTIRDYELEVPDLKAVLKGGVLSLDAKNMVVEGAKITGTASVDAREAQPKLATKFKAQGVDPKVLFEAAGQDARITGKASVEVDLNGSGNSARKLIDTLSGRVKATTGKGAIVGYDLTNVFSGLVGYISGYNERSRTPFDELEADVALTNGVSSKSTVEITGPIVGVSGKGAVRLTNRQIDYRAQVNLLSWGQSFAVRILGGWLRPEFDVTGWNSLPSERTIVPAAPLEPLQNADLKDPELARLAAEVLQKGTSQGTLSPQVTEALQEVKARAEGSK